jgi:hypothetical protein
MAVELNGGWKFIDRIADATVFAVDVENGKFVVSSFTDTVLVHHRFFGKVGEEEEGMGLHSNVASSTPGPAISVVSVRATMNDGSTRLYLSDAAVYLLSDTGKTIERLN